MANGPRFSTGAEGTPLSELKMGRDTPMTQEEIRRGPGSPQPPSYKLTVSKGKINLKPVKKTSGKNIVSRTEVEEFANYIIPKGGGEKTIDPPRLGGYMPPEAYVPERRTGYRREVIDPQVDTQQLKPTSQRRTGLQQTGPMDDRGGSQLLRNNPRTESVAPVGVQPITILPKALKYNAPPKRIENTMVKPRKPISAYEGDPEFDMKEVSPETGGFEEGMSFYGGGKVHKTKKKKKKTYGKKYAKGGGIRKPKYS